MTENEKLRKLLEEARDAVKRSMGAWTWAGYEDHTTDEKALVERINAALAEPVKETHDGASDWACYDCGSVDGFHTVQHPAGDYDVECSECGSAHTAEAPQVLRDLARDLDTIRAERDEARAALADAYRRGAEAMKRAAVAACDDEAVSHRQIGRMTDEYRAFGAYLAAARVEALPIPEDRP